MDSKENKLVPFHKNKEFRRLVKEATSEGALSKAEEEKLWVRFSQTPLGKKIALKLLKLSAEGVGDDEINRVFNEMIYEDWEEALKLKKEVERDLKEKIIGIRNTKGGFTCLDCIAQEAWNYIDEDKVITLFDLHDTLFQCDKCKRKFKLGKTKWDITFIEFISEQEKG